ncbi:MAG: nicotinamide-nucleotide amidohydrolase family protein [Pseudomonadota bacterium]
MQEPSLTEFARRLSSSLQEANIRLMTAESCTGGWMAKVATDLAGSSDWFEGGVVSYSNALKMRLLGVEEAVLAAHGAVSEPVVRAMALGAAALGACDAAIAVSGVAGPGGGSEEKPVGLVWFGFFLVGRCWAESCRFDGDRDQVRRQSVAFAFNHLHQALTRHLSGS